MKIFLFFFMEGNKIAGSAQKTGSVGLAETLVFVCLIYLIAGSYSSLQN